MSRSYDDAPRRRPDYDDDGFEPRRGGESNGLATAAVVLGALGIFCGLTSIPAIICGILGLNRAGQLHGRGHGPAMAGLILGVVTLLIMPIAGLIGLLLPAVQKVREAAARSAEMNNLRQIALGMHNHNAAHGVLPTYARFSNDAARTPLSSWRVSVLPFIEQDAVFRMMKLDLPWDDPANRPATGLAIRTYCSPADSPPLSDQTHYRVFVGPGTAFEDVPPGQPPTSFPRSFTDGTANTILVIESADTVPWAAPKELAFQPGGPLPSLGHPRRPLILVAMADGSMRAAPKTVSPQTLNAAITRNGGEQLGPDW
jgi:Protein of unknown function (DUF1559)/Domain of unknown function (DUF4190)